MWLTFPRRLSIEEVSVIFDKGRLGKAADAVAEFHEERKETETKLGDKQKAGATTVEEGAVA
jgi:hypothetical protein